MEQPQNNPPPRAACIAWAATALLGATLVTGAARPGAQAPPAPSRAVFARRILPLLRANNPSTCSECHLSGVDLKDYIRPTEAQTFAALRDRGMIDVRHPEESRILKFIRMSRPKTPLVTQKVREVEYTAFHDWIVAAAGNPRLANAPTSPVTQPVGPVVPDAVIRHTRIDAIVASFERNVWSQQGRCMNCHQAGTPDNDAKVRQFGPRVAWFKPDSPEETMRTLIAQGDVDVDHPGQSLILLKPLNRVPHGGGTKMAYGDAGYKLFRAWVEDYAASVKGKYRTVADLPAPPRRAFVDMDSVMAVDGGPAAWADHLLRVDVYAWDAARAAWMAQPVASGERQAFGDKDKHTSGTNLIMFLTVPARDAPAEAARLHSTLTPGGRYLLKYYCDTGGKLNRDYTLPTDSPEFYQGRQEVTATWFGGWGNTVKVHVTMAPSGGAP